MPNFTYSDADIGKMLGGAADGALPGGLWATELRYDEAVDRIVVMFDSGWGVLIDRSRIPQLADVPQADLSDLRLSGAGNMLFLDSHDIHVNIEALVVSLIPLSLLRKEIGKRGGQATSAAKAAAVRLNGRLGGRPRKDAGREGQRESRPKPAVPVSRSVHPDHLVCLEDGTPHRMLTRHLRSAHDMTPEEYRAKWRLPADYPMVAPGPQRKSGVG